MPPLRVYQCLRHFSVSILSSIASVLAHFLAKKESLFICFSHAAPTSGQRALKEDEMVEGEGESNRCMTIFGHGLRIGKGRSMDPRIHRSPSKAQQASHSSDSRLPTTKGIRRIWVSLALRPGIDESMG